jgi:NADH-quinone oxidoreductase subunit A
MEGWLAVVLMVALGSLVGVAGTTLSRMLGPRKPTPEKEAPYECGVPPVGDARERQSVKFYLVAMIFLLFDIEVVFVYPWVMALRGEDGLGWTGFVQILVFFGLLLTGFIYVWRKGVLDWGSQDGL